MSSCLLYNIIMYLVDQKICWEIKELWLKNNYPICMSVPRTKPMLVSNRWPNFREPNSNLWAYPPPLCCWDDLTWPIFCWPNLVLNDQKSKTWPGYKHVYLFKSGSFVEMNRIETEPGYICLHCFYHIVWIDHGHYHTDNVHR